MNFNMLVAGQSFSNMWPVPAFIDDFLLGFAIAQSFHEINEYAEINNRFTSVTKDGWHRATVCLSSLPTELVY
jgi:hypothetical protein